MVACNVSNELYMIAATHAANNNIVPSSKRMSRAFICLRLANIVYIANAPKIYPRGTCCAG